MFEPAKPLVAISSCLLGQPVRYDGATKRDDFVCNQLSKIFDWLPICPEVAIGLGVPRPPIQVVAGNQGIRVVEVNDPKKDVTDDLRKYANQQAKSQTKLCGYIFKARSPSCALHDLPIHNLAGEVIANNGVGEFARVFQQQRPNIPLIDERQLQDEQQRYAFITAVHHRYKRHL